MQSLAVPRIAGWARPRGMERAEEPARRRGDHAPAGTALPQAGGRLGVRLLRLKTI